MVTLEGSHWRYIHVAAAWWLSGSIIHARGLNVFVVGFQVNLLVFGVSALEFYIALVDVAHGVDVLELVEVANGLADNSVGRSQLRDIELASVLFVGRHNLHRLIDPGH